MQEPGFYRDGISALVAKLDECISGRGFGPSKDTLMPKKATAKIYYTEYLKLHT